MYINYILLDYQAMWVELSKWTSRNGPARQARNFSGLGPFNSSPIFFQAF
jgi:hypothetical protein